MAAANKKTNTAQAVNTTPAQEPEINEVDGEPMKGSTRCKPTTSSAPTSKRHITYLCMTFSLR